VEEKLSGRSQAANDLCDDRHVGASLALPFRAPNNSNRRCPARNPINPASLFAAPRLAWSVRDAVRLVRPKRWQVLR
jgi:hypothetical protein